MIQSNFPILSFSIWFPILSGILILIIGHSKNFVIVRWLSLVSAIVSLLITLPLIYKFDTTQYNYQFVEKICWVRNFNINYFLGIDGFSLWFIPLTAFITIIVILTSWETIKRYIAQYMGAFLILSGLIIGAFSALDGLLFYVFFEATLIPMFIIIGVWGGVNRVYAAFKFFLYTFFGSLLMLIALIYLYILSDGSFEISIWQRLSLSMLEQKILFFAFLIAFAVKIPMWPIHTWLPDAHVEAPTSGSIILASIMLKLGAYGFLRFLLPITPDASFELANFIIILSLIAVIYISLVALVQQDMKKLVAYSSIAHMGFVTLGFFIFNDITMQGSIIQMISHSFISGAMFILIGILYDRMHTRDIIQYSGVVDKMPRFAVFFVFFSLANCGLPATSGFVGEFLVILGAIKFNFWVGLLAAITMILGAAYSLWLVKRIIFGVITNDCIKYLTDINKREFLILGLLVIAVFMIGLYPAFLIDAIQLPVKNLLQHITISKIN